MKIGTESLDDVKKQCKMTNFFFSSLHIVNGFKDSFPHPKLTCNCVKILIKLPYNTMRYPKKINLTKKIGKIKFAIFKQ